MYRTNIHSGGDDRQRMTTPASTRARRPSPGLRRRQRRLAPMRAPCCAAGPAMSAMPLVPDARGQDAAQRSQGRRSHLCGLRRRPRGRVLQPCRQCRATQPGVVPGRPQHARPGPGHPAGAARRRRGLARPSPRLRPSGRRRPPHPLRSRGRRRPRRRRAGHRREGKCLPRRAPANPCAAFSLQRLRRPASRTEQGRSRPPACGSGRCRSCSASSSTYPWTHRTPSRS